VLWSDSNDIRRGGLDLLVVDVDRDRVDRAAGAGLEEPARASTKTPPRPAERTHESSQPVPIAGGAPFVIAGLTSLALPANGCMCAFHAAAAACGLRLLCAPRSGSLKPRRWRAPASMPFCASAAQLLTCVASAPHSIGTYSTPAGSPAPTEEYQLYANEAALPNGVAADTSLKPSPRLPEFAPDVGAGAAAEDVCGAATDVCVVGTGGATDVWVGAATIDVGGCVAAAVDGVAVK
jgi:hypothetical protein